MKFGILSDVHANLEALEVALKFLRDAEVDEIVFLGDAVGYVPIRMRSASFYAITASMPVSETMMPR